MAKLILSLDGALLNEYPLIEERTSIGRRSTNDIHLDNLAISGNHAVIEKVGNDFYVEDLGSTNGTRVNDVATKKHLLQHDDVIEFGKFQLKYVDETAPDNEAADSSAAFEKTILIRPSAPRSHSSPLPDEPALPDGKVADHLVADQQVGNQPAPSSTDVSTAVKPAVHAVGKVGKVQVLNGSNSGRELVLNKALTTLGKAGIQVAVITKRPNGYFITHVEGQVLPIVNGVSAGTQAHALNDHDVIELAGVKMEFYLANL